MIQHVKRIVIGVFLLSVSSLLHATPYGHYDPQKMLQKKTGENGSSYSFNISRLDEILLDLMAHALQYPAKFDSSADKIRATQDTRIIISVLNIYLETTPNADFDIIGRAALINHIGHTLDIAGSGERATQFYERLLTIKPDDEQTNYLYAVFLLSSGKCKKSIAYFDKSIKAGNVFAQLMQGVAYISCNDKNNALTALNAYAKKRPDDEKAKFLIKSIKEGRFEIKNMPSR